MFRTPLRSKILASEKNTLGVRSTVENGEMRENTVTKYSLRFLDEQKGNGDS